MWTLVIWTFCLPFILLAHGSSGAPGTVEYNKPSNVSVHRIDVQGHEYPRHLQFRRKGQATWHGKTRYRLVGSNQAWVVELKPYYQHYYLKLNLTNPRALAQSGCYYKGHIVGEILSTVKVSLCEGMVGDIHTSQGDYVIYPINHPSEDSFQIHHLSYLQHQDPKRPWRPLVAEEIPFCGVEETTVNYPKVNKLRSFLHLNKSENSRISSELLNRKKRSESRELHLEVLVVADSKMASYHGSNLNHYVLTLMSTVGLIYKDPSIGNNINIAVVDIVVLNETTDRQIIHHIAPITLRQFCQWQHKHNIHDDRNPAHYDTAILITREDLCRYPGACDTLGLAQSGMVCDSDSSCAIVEDNGLSAAFTIAHELGHVMSLPHDDDPKCNRYHTYKKKLHVMARMLDYNSHPWSWSECSRHYLTTFFDIGYGKCLTDRPGRNRLLLDDEFQQPPGQLYPRDRQCELVFGPKSRICPYMPECKRLWCTLDNTMQGGCRTQHMPWADGTQCSDTKRCFQGECMRYRHAGFVPVDGQWGKWGPYGLCSRSCGGGIQQAFRECDSPKPANGGRYCTGIRVQYKSCNTQECPSGSRDFRAEQCAEFNGKYLNLPGIPRSVYWVPQYSGITASEKCKLYCKVNDSSSYFVLNQKVIDGTPCDLGTYNICVNGKCEVAGCDHMLNSTVALDRCGVCGGSNNTCKEIKGHFNKKVDYGYHNVVMIPPGASNIRIIQHSSDGNVDDNYIGLFTNESRSLTVKLKSVHVLFLYTPAMIDQTANFKALKDPLEKYILNGDFMINMFPKTLMYHGVPIDYSGSHSVVEHVNTSEPLPKDLFVQVLVVGMLQPPNISFSYTVPISKEQLYNWKVATQYSECSRICNGISALKPVCVRISDQYHVNDNHCADIAKPNLQKTRKCNEHCNLIWKDVSTSECSVQCGRGIRRRIIKCMKEEISTKIAHAVPEEYCAYVGPKPNTEIKCWGSCQNSTWIYSDWSECSVSCGKGIQQRSAECRNSKNVKQSDSHCDPNIKFISKICDNGPCPYWKVGNWTECSEKCGSGIKQRPIWCQHNDKYVDQRYCNEADIPDAKEVCSTGDCYDWFVGEWEPCSSSCDSGTSQRNVYCRSSSFQKVDDSFCIHVTRPNKKRNCSSGISCVSNINVKRHSSNSFKKWKPSLHVYSDSNAIPEFNHAIWKDTKWSKCSNSCGEGFRRRTLTCHSSEDDSRLPLNYCDQKNKPKSVEKCFGTKCSLWEVGEWSECSCDERIKKRNVSCNSNMCSIQNKPHEAETCECSIQFTNTSTSNWKTGPWAECSVTCGNGVKRRQVVCYGYDDSPSSDCNFQRKPSETFECNNGPCPDWATGEWSECNSCGEGLQTRSVLCFNDDGHRISDESCDILKKPKAEQACFNHLCKDVDIFKWITGPWSQCSTSCDEGVQNRNIICLNMQGHEEDPNKCSQPSPPQSQTCITAICPKWQWSEWSKCPSSCKFHEQHRLAHCIRGDRIVDDNNCFEPKPETEKRRCKIPPECSFKWRKGVWSQCHASCGLSYKIREIVCVDNENNRTPDELCASQEKPKRKRKCKLRPCPYSWITGQWSECSKSCDEGTRSRTVSCHAVNDYGFVDSEEIDETNARRLCGSTRKPRNVEKCNYGNCSSGYIWKPDEWKKCEGSCENSKQKRKLRCYNLDGQKVPNYKCNPILKPKKKRPCSLPQCTPKSCLDIRNLKRKTDNGDYEIYVKGKPVTVYCHAMNTRHPQEYIILRDHNYAVIYSTELGNNFRSDTSENCFSNDVLRSCDCNRSDFGYTIFYKIALNITTLNVITNDYTFSTTYYGKPVPYGSAGDCSRKPKCPQGIFFISLQGTDFRVASESQWIPKSGMAELTLQRIRDDQVVKGKCGGYCDLCIPDPRVGLVVDIVLPL